MRVVADALLPDPDSGRPAFRQEHHRLMADVRSRTEEEGAERCRRDVDGAASVGRRDGIGIAVHNAPLQIEEAQPVLRTHQFT